MTGIEDIRRVGAEQLLREHCGACNGQGGRFSVEQDRWRWCTRCKGAGYTVRGTHDAASSLDAPDARDVEIERLKAENRRLTIALQDVQALVAAQAEDEGLWFLAQFASEAYLQSALRDLHAVVEGELSSAAAVAATRGRAL